MMVEDGMMPRMEIMIKNIGIDVSRKVCLASAKSLDQRKKILAHNRGMMSNESATYSIWQVLAFPYLDVISRNLIRKRRVTFSN